MASGGQYAAILEELGHRLPEAKPRAAPKSKKRKAACKSSTKSDTGSSDGGGSSSDEGASPSPRPSKQARAGHVLTKSNENLIREVAKGFGEAMGAGFQRALSSRGGYGGRGGGKPFARGGRGGKSPRGKGDRV
jgi:hypothetical protein